MIRIYQNSMGCQINVTRDCLKDIIYSIYIYIIIMYIYIHTVYIDDLLTHSNRFCNTRIISSNGWMLAAGAKVDGRPTREWGISQEY